MRDCFVPFFTTIYFEILTSSLCHGGAVRSERRHTLKRLWPVACWTEVGHAGCQTTVSWGVLTCETWRGGEGFHLEMKVGGWVGDGSYRQLMVVYFFWIRRVLDSWLMVLGCSCCLLERKRKNLCGFFGCFVVLICCWFLIITCLITYLTLISHNRKKEQKRRCNYLENMIVIACAWSSPHHHMYLIFLMSFLERSQIFFILLLLSIVYCLKAHMISLIVFQISLPLLSHDKTILYF